MQRDVKVNDTANNRIRNAPRDADGVIHKQAPPNLLVKIQDIFFECLRSWKWFLLTLLICLGIGYYNIRKTPNLYKRSASIMIKGDERNASTSAFEELGIEVTPKNVSNEIMAINSVDLASKVARRLNFDVQYFREAAFHNKIIYGQELLYKIQFHDIPDETTLNCILELRPDSIVTISNIVKDGKPYTGKLMMKLGQTRKTPMGIISLEPTEFYTPGATQRMIVNRNSMGAATNAVARNLSAALRSREATIIDIDFIDLSGARAEAVLNAVVDVYNEGWIEDRNKIAQSTKAFIDERIEAIEQELNLVENSIADYKSENLMLKIEGFGEEAMERVLNTEDRDYEVDNQIYMVEYVKEFIEDPNNDKRLIPANTGIGNKNIETQIGEYNGIILRRSGHLAHSSEQNPLVMDLDESLEILKASIIQSIDNELTLLNNEKRTLQSQRNEALERVSASPRKSNYIKAIERQQTVKESLYMFLLQKREDNELSQAFTAYNSRLIEPPHGSNAPISPVPKQTYLLAFIFGIGIPAALIIVKESMNTVVRGRKDIEYLSVPFIGEIPLDKNSDKRAKMIAKENKRRKKGGKRKIKEPPAEFVVIEKSRNVMNEAFRVVRTNMEFVLGFDNKHNVIMVTSLNPSSGKTFISANLASSMGVNNKRVIAVDLDMRKGNLSKYVNKPTYGVANYLSGQIYDYHTLIVHTPNVDILPCGSLPPNPSELLYSDAFSRMIDELRVQYDYVFLDCPPVEVVADATIINRFADITLFVIRAQLLDRSFLPDIEKWYEEKRYNNLTIILNGTTDAFSKYGYHKYGYRYGYHYGNYGYGYGNDD